MAALALVTGCVLLVAGAPAVPERFADDANPSHVLLVVDSVSGETIRAEGAEAAEHEAFPPGASARLILVLAGLEEGAFDASFEVPCDARCWAEGAHGRPNLVAAFAVGCDSWFREARARLDGGTIRRWALRAGLGPDVPDAAAIDASEDFPGPGWGITARAWVRFWRRLARGDLADSDRTTATLLAATAGAVSFPRGVARSLVDPQRRVRAAVGETEAGAWVTGLRAVRGTPPWAFALFVRGGTGALAAARADFILRETIRVRDHATVRRDRAIPEPIDFDER